MPNSEQRQEAIETLTALIGDIPVAMLATSTSQHALRSRPMVNINVKFEGELWFFSKADDPKVNEVKANPQVNVSFMSPSHDRYISISGSASVVRDPKRNELLWTEACQKWFPEGRDDPQLTLLRIEVDYAEYWDAKAGAMQEFSGLVRRVLSGSTRADKKSELEHESIDWQQPEKSSGVGK